MSAHDSQEIDWPMLLVFVVYVAGVAVGSTLAVLSGRWELAVAFIGGAASTTAIMLWFGSR